MKRYHMDACEFNGHYIVSYQDGKKMEVYSSLSQIEGDGINWHKVRNCILGKSARAYKLEWKKVKNNSPQSCSRVKTENTFLKMYKIFE